MFSYVFHPGDPVNTAQDLLSSILATAEARAREAETRAAGSIDSQVVKAKTYENLYKTYYRNINIYIYITYRNLYETNKHVYKTYKNLYTMYNNLCSKGQRGSERCSGLASDIPKGGRAGGV